MRTASGAFDLTKTEIASGSESTTPLTRLTLPVSTTQIDVCFNDTGDGPLAAVEGLRCDRLGAGLRPRPANRFATAFGPSYGRDQTKGPGFRRRCRPCGRAGDDELQATGLSAASL